MTVANLRDPFSSCAPINFRWASAHSHMELSVGWRLTAAVRTAVISPFDRLAPRH